MDGLLSAFAHQLEGVIQAPLRCLGALERELALPSADHFLALNLITFLLVSALAFPLLARVHHIPGWQAKAPAIMVFGLWVCMGMGVECRAGTTDVRASGGGGGQVVDVGHQLLEPIHFWAVASPGLAQLVASANTVYCMAIAAIAVWSTFGWDDPRLLLAAIPAGCIRMVVGVLTRMPVPDGYVAKPGDWPPPSPHCRGFVLNPSGHVMNATLACLYLHRVGHTRMFIVASILNGAQAMWLVGARGHYTVDIITALLICAAVEPTFGGAGSSSSRQRGWRPGSRGLSRGQSPAPQRCQAKKHR
jgi:hypothetical protein